MLTAAVEPAACYGKSAEPGWVRQSQRASARFRCQPPNLIRRRARGACHSGTANTLCRPEAGAADGAALWTSERLKDLMRVS